MAKYEHKEKSNVLIYHNITTNLELIATLQGYAPIGKLFLDIMHYSKDNKIPEYSADEATIQLVFNQVKESIDINREKYEAACKKNAENRNSKKNNNSISMSQIINSETGEVIESDLSSTEDDNVSKADNSIPTQKMILDYFIKEKRKSLTSKQAQDCLEYIICYKDDCDSWEEKAESWFSDSF